MTCLGRIRQVLRDYSTHDAIRRNTPITFTSSYRALNPCTSFKDKIVSLLSNNIVRLTVSNMEKVDYVLNKTCKICFRYFVIQINIDRNYYKVSILIIKITCTVCNDQNEKTVTRPCWRSHSHTARRNGFLGLHTKCLV